MHVLKKFILLKKLNFILFLFVLSNCECTGGTQKKGISIVYLFDVSGSFYQDALSSSIILSEKIFDDIISPGGIPFYSGSQIHQIATIDQKSITKGGLCSVVIKEKNIFDNTSKNKSIDHCLNLVKSAQKASATNIKGALFNAGKALENDNLYGKGIIIFSDMREEVSKIKKYPINLNGVSVFVIWEISNAQLEDPTSLQQDKNNLKTLLLDAGCENDKIKFKSLSSVINSPNMVSKYFRNSFKK